ATGSIAAEDQGLYKVTDETRQAFAASGALNSKEWSDPRATSDLLKPLVEETGGGVQAVSISGQPAWRRVPVDGAMAGNGWLGLRQNADYTVTGVTNMPLLPSWAALLLALSLVMLAWRRESKQGCKAWSDRIAGQPRADRAQVGGEIIRKGTHMRRGFQVL